MADDSQHPSGWAVQIRSIIPSLLLTVLIAFATSWWNSQISSAQLTFRIQVVEKAVEIQGGQITQNSAVIQQNAIRMAEIARDQLNIAEQVKEVRQTQAQQTKR